MKGPCRKTSKSLTTEAKIDAGTDNVVGVVDIDESLRQERELRVEGDPLGAEIVVAVFDEGRQAVRERVFAAAADGPARPIVACAVCRADHGCRCAVIDPLPGGAALDIEECAADGVPRRSVTEASASTSLW